MVGFEHTWEETLWKTSASRDARPWPPASPLSYLCNGRAQQYPDRPVKWIVAYAAGGGSDVLARLVGTGLSNRLG